MLLKIHLLQVMSIGLITVPIKAQGPLLAEVPELYMEDSDRVILNSIWNMAGFPSNQNEQEPEVARKFLGVLTKIGPGVLRNVIPHLGKIPGFPDKMKPVLPLLTSLIPARMIDLTGIKHTNNINRQHTGTDRSYGDSLTTINYNGLRKPFNSELDSSEEDESPELNSNTRALHLKNPNLELFDDNRKETNYLTKNLETSPQDLETMNQAMKQIKRMMQGVHDNKYNNEKLWNFLQRKTHQNMNVGKQSLDTTTEDDIPSKSRKNYNPFDVAYIGPFHEEVDLQNKNSHMDYMHKKKYNTTNTAGNSETSSHHPIGVSHKCAEERKESSRISDKSPETSKYFDMLQNNQMIHNVEGYNPMMHQLGYERSATVDGTQLKYKQNKVTE